MGSQTELNPTEIGNLVGEMTDADMMEAEPSPPPQVCQHNQPTAEIWNNLLVCVRKLIDQGKPSQALKMLVKTMREHIGEAAVAQTMKRACEIYHNNVNATAVDDELVSLFAECAIAEKKQSSTEPKIEPPSVVYTEPDKYGKSILDQTGRKQIMLDAFSDGSSFVCSRCGGLVSVLRKDEHDAYWCCKSV